MSRPEGCGIPVRSNRTQVIRDVRNVHVRDLGLLAHQPAAETSGQLVCHNRALDRQRNKELGKWFKEHTRVVESLGKRQDSYYSSLQTLHRLKAETSISHEQIPPEKRQVNGANLAHNSKTITLVRERTKNEFESNQNHIFVNKSKPHFLQDLTKNDQIRTFARDDSCIKSSTPVLPVINDLTRHSWPSSPNLHRRNSVLKAISHGTDDVVEKEKALLSLEHSLKKQRRKAKVGKIQVHQQPSQRSTPVKKYELENDKQQLKETDIPYKRQTFPIVPIRDTETESRALAKIEERHKHDNDERIQRLKTNLEAFEEWNPMDIIRPERSINRQKERLAQKRWRKLGLLGHWQKAMGGWKKTTAAGNSVEVLKKCRYLRF